VPVRALRRSPDPPVYCRANQGHKLRGQKSYRETRHKTVRLMEAIDAEIEAHGSWPL
jgi:hypothetical protein